MVKYIQLFVFILIISTTRLLAQEYLVPLSGNPSIAEHEQPKKHKSVQALELPFIDDFSNNGVYPDPNYWNDAFVFVNNGFGIGPISIGVATFDALDENGKHYSNAGTNPYPADVLTSKAIDLSQANQNTTYLSFYYQPEGNGANYPEENDSLLLQFSPDGSAWETVWFANGLSFDEFYADSLDVDPDRPIDTVEFLWVNLQLNKPEYFTSNFQFRFMNYASLSGEYDPSAAINCDFWNIDYVYLDDNRSATDNIIDDIVFVEPPASFMKNYASVPWTHFPEAIVGEIKDVGMHLRNNSDETRNVSQLSLHFRNLDTHWVDSFNLGQYDLFPLENNNSPTQKFSESPVLHNSDEQAHFEMEARIKVDDEDFSKNNQAFRYVDFENYYAYDDGTAENGYGVDAFGAKVACRFKLYKPDSLKGVKMFFQPNYPQYVAAESFKLTIWEEENGLPGNIIVQEVGKELDFGDNLNEFVTIELDTTLYLEGTFYLGWEQTSALRLNVGFDKNNNSKQNIYYNIGGEWLNSEFIGSLMMRPMFGSLMGTAVSDFSFDKQITLYPNPANETLYIKGLNDGTPHVATIYNALGAKMLETQVDGGPVNIEALPEGMYLLNIRGGRQTNKTLRFIKAQ